MLPVDYGLGIPNYALYHKYVVTRPRTDLSSQGTYFYERNTLGPLTMYSPKPLQNAAWVTYKYFCSTIAVQGQVVVGLKRTETSRHVSSSKSLYSLERTQNRSNVSEGSDKNPLWAYVACHARCQQVHTPRNFLLNALHLRFLWGFWR